MVVVHHICADGFSMGPLARDVMVAYEPDAGRGAGLVAVAGAVRGLRVVAAGGAGSEDDPESLIARQIAYWCDALSRAAG